MTVAWDSSVWTEGERCNTNVGTTVRDTSVAVADMGCLEINSNLFEGFHTSVLEVDACGDIGKELVSPRDSLLLHISL